MNFDKTDSANQEWALTNFEEVLHINKNFFISSFAIYLMINLLHLSSKYLKGLKYHLHTKLE